VSGAAVTPAGPAADAVADQSRNTDSAHCAACEVTAALSRSGCRVSGYGMWSVSFAGSPGFILTFCSPPTQN
jgi:hypothetical protein